MYIANSGAVTKKMLIKRSITNMLREEKMELYKMFNQNHKRQKEWKTKITKTRNFLKRNEYGR